MTTTFRACSLMQAIVRCFSGTWIILLLAACDAHELGVQNQASVDGRGIGKNPPAGVQLRIEVGELDQQLPDTALLYAFARVPGERMPLIVEYFAVNDVPALIPFLVTETVEELEVVVRIAPLGQVQRGPQDLEVTVQTAVQHPPLIIDVSMPEATAKISQRSALVAAVE